MTFVIWNAQGLLIDSSSSTKQHLNFLVISSITSDLYIELLSDALKAVQCNVMQCNKLQFSTVQRSEKKKLFSIFLQLLLRLSLKEPVSTYYYSYFLMVICKTMKREDCLNFFTS